MRKNCAVIVLFFLFIMARSANAGPWCQKNCHDLCVGTAAKAGVSVADCEQANKCSSYAGRPCASQAHVQQRKRSYRANARARSPLPLNRSGACHGGSFDACFSFSTHRRGWDTNNAQLYCHRNCNS